MPNIDEIRIVGQEITYDIRPKEDASHQNVSAEEKATWNAKSDFSGNYADLQGKPDLSQFVTKVVDDLTNYYLKSETYTKQEVQQLLSSFNSGVFKIVDTLPTASAATTGLKIYLVPSQNQEAQNVKDEFITIEENGSYRWEQIGSTAMSLDGYVTETALNQALSSYVTSSAFTSALAQKQDKLVSGENIKTVNGESILGSGNIVAGDPNAIKYTEQSLTDSQKTQARTNIGAAAASALTALETAIAAKYSKPASGIPEADLNSNVQSALALARTSIQSLAEYYNKTEIDALLAAVNSEQYVDVTTLPTASASTLGKIYLVGPNTNGVYTRHYTSYDGSTYSWVAVGTTEINLANYATKAELDQLGQEVHTLSGKYYGLFTSSAILPSEITQPGYAFVGSSTPFAIWNFDGSDWTDTGVTADAIHGEDGVGFASVASQQDGTIVITLTNGDTVTIDLNHDHPAYPKYELMEDEAEYQAIATKESDKLYLIPEV